MIVNHADGREFLLPSVSSYTPIINVSLREEAGGGDRFSTPVYPKLLSAAGIVGGRRAQADDLIYLKPVIDN